MIFGVGRRPSPDTNHSTKMEFSIVDLSMGDNSKEIEAFNVLGQAVTPSDNRNSFILSKY